MVTPIASGNEMSDFNGQLGTSIRRARRARGWSLIDVEDASEGEFKASVLGAYERGERSLSVSRLTRLAELYQVTTADLIPTMKAMPSDEVMIDLVAAEEMEGERAQVIDQYLAAIRLMRSGARRPASVRQSDLRVLAALIASDDLETVESDDH